jgi:LysR family transcriptional regulator, glycine cleavage system transcriptional activator
MEESLGERRHESISRFGLRRERIRRAGIDGRLVLRRQSIKQPQAVSWSHMPLRPLPSLKGLQAFEAFAREGSMSRAAEALFVTHGAVSRQVKALERQLGARLVTGPRHRLALTAAGRELASSLSAAFDMIAASLPGAEDAQELVVSCIGALAMKWLIPRLPRFVDKHPGLRVRIVESQAPVDFSQGGLHAAIRLKRGAPEPGVRALAFMDHHYGPVLAPALFDQVDRDPVRALHLPHLYSETFASGWVQWANDSAVALPPSAPERGFEHNAYMLEAAAAGLGVAITAWAFAEADIESGRLVAPWGFQPLTTRFSYLRPALARNEAASAFGAWLREEGRRSPRPPGPTNRHEPAAGGSGPG